MIQQQAGDLGAGCGAMTAKRDEFFTLNADEIGRARAQAIEIDNTRRC